jgi:uncharacterized metal-binding protein YceD (DUF177 family)
MTRSDEKIWSRPVAVAQIPEGGLHLDIEADAAQREAMAKAAKLRTIANASASFDIRRAAGDGFHVTGTVRATVGQDCVVTLEPIENAIEEDVDVTFEPARETDAGVRTKTGANPAGTKPDDEGAEDQPDPPEPIENGQIDLGRLAQDFLFLGIDPYPRKPGATFDVPETPPDPEDHPFAALKALKEKPESPRRGKPKRG